MTDKQEYMFKIANNEYEFQQIHQLNYETFVEEIPQHEQNQDRMLIDKFHDENTYLICIKDQQLIGMMAVRDQRPFSLEQKLGPVETLLPIQTKRLCEIRLLAVRKDFRSGRVFLGLSQFLSSYCLHKGYDAAIISGTVRQLKLYHQLGFQDFAYEIGADEAKYQPMYISKKIFEEIMAAKIRKKTVSFLPGPIVVEDAIRQAIQMEPISHRSMIFQEAMKKVQSQLCSLTNAQYVQILLGSGTLANDAIAGQLSLLKGTGLILVNGEFGERLRKQALRMGLSFEVYEKPWGQPFEEAELREHIQSHTTWLWGVHSETSTGMLNAVDSWKKVAAEYGLQLCVDCISSLGCVPLDLKDVYLASGVSGKGIGAFTGLSFVFHNHRILPSEKLPAYLDIGVYMENDSVPFSHSSNLLEATSAALLKTDLNYERVTLFYDMVRREVEEMGLAIVAPRAYASPIIVTIVFPPHLSAQEIGRILQYQGFSLHYASRYLTDRNWLQIACIGNNSSEEISTMLRLLKQVYEYEEYSYNQSLQLS